MSNTSRGFTALMVAWLLFGVGLECHAQTAAKTTSLGKWDSAWQLFGAEDRLLTEITIKNGKIDFSRPAAQSRTEPLTSLYNAGVRKIYSSVLSPLAISSQGQIGPAFSSPTQKGFFQAIKPGDDGSIDLKPMAYAQGHGGLAFKGAAQSGFFQALKERADGFDLANGEGSQILDTSGSVPATVTTANGAPALTFSPVSP